MNLAAKVLGNLAPWRDAPAWRIALSGGLDSTVLLHLLARLAQREELPPLSALHIHHGLQASADAWPAACQRLCNALSVPLQVIPVRVASGASVERAAREARYGALQATLGAGEVLFTAHHADDQAETLLFRLLRGAGVSGLAGMPVVRTLGTGQLVRPLLNCARAELQAYAEAHGLSWVEDPSNTDEQLSRNYLRQQVVPALRTRWPAVVENLVRTAGHMTEATQLLDELAASDLIAAQVAGERYLPPLPCLSLSALRGLSEARQRNALRHWLRPWTQMPDTAHWAGWQALRDAAPDAAPAWRLQAGELRRTDERLWWLTGIWLSDPVMPAMAVSGNAFQALPGNGQVRIEGQLPAGNWQLAYRQGGERMLVAGRGSRDLKRLLNERQVPAFLRQRLPLLLCDGELRAVANLPGLDGDPQGQWRVQWQPPTNDPGLSW
ncbi:MAG TPA: tRNA lysidine(34) synthetase TilS [Pseudomonas sp.]|nr:tRNA lysidine(34) synthetase TilS [Pseudomonas sp.]